MHKPANINDLKILMNVWTKIPLLISLPLLDTKTQCCYFLQSRLHYSSVQENYYALIIIIIIIFLKISFRLNNTIFQNVLTQVFLFIFMKGANNFGSLHCLDDLRCEVAFNYLHLRLKKRMVKRFSAVWEGVAFVQSERGGGTLCSASVG